ncbi:MAG: lanthionine synthetase LanC family protein [Acidobacteriota bacterium]
MNVTEPLVLRNDVVLVPVSELPPDVRAKIDFEEGDYAVSRLHGRMPSQIIDPETASLLKLFREPTTIVDAVIRNSRELSKDPRSWLDELLPFIGIFLRNRVLAPAGSGEEPDLRPLVEAGARAGDWTVERCVNLIEDSEIHRVHREGIAGALKLARDPVPFEGSVFGNEIAILRHLDGLPLVPRLLDHGHHDGRPWLVSEWCDGSDAGVATALGRHDRVALLELCTRIAAAYAELHDRGVIHADVHPRNVLVGPGSRVMLIDFGLSRLEGSALPEMPRGGMYYFFEPEYLASLRGPRQREASRAGEQYALAALLYLILTGKHYLEFRFDRDEMMRQAQYDPPLPFADRDLPPWPDVEAILGRALEKDPARRFADLHELTEALQNAHARAASAMPSLPESALALVEEELSSLHDSGAYPTPPHASVNYGAAGAALGILCIAEVRGDARLLALADVWRSRAATFAGERAGWYAEEHDVPESMIGAVTPYHTVTGLHAVSALLAYARGDSYGLQRATRDFLESSNVPCQQIDLTLGRSGTLLAAALLLERGCEAVRPAGEALVREVWTRLDALPAIAALPRDTYLGMAHGWSGYLYATLRWCAASGAPLPSAVPSRLSDLAGQRIPRGRGAFWPRTVGGGLVDMMPGWCNGAAGHVFTWTAAHDMFRDGPWLSLAEEAAWSAWEEPLHASDLCCGSAGRAYALLDLYRRTGDRAWLARARQLAIHAASNARATSQRAHALWKGELGVAVLLAQLDCPEEARMPLFG